jgi:hypothetical protein
MSREAVEGSEHFAHFGGLGDRGEMFFDGRWNGTDQVSRWVRLCFPFFDGITKNPADFATYPMGGVSRAPTVDSVDHCEDIRRINLGDWPFADPWKHIVFETG